MTLSILIWFPLVIAVIASQLPARVTGRIAVGWSVITIGCLAWRPISCVAKRR